MEAINNMFKKILSMIACAITLGTTCFGLVSCGDNEEETTSQGRQTTIQEGHDSTKWFTDEELSKVGLEGLTAPTGLTGEMNSDIAWFNNGYSFSQPCPDKDTFELNAETYFSYFKNHYDGKFGKPRIEKLGMETNETWYVIEQKNLMSEYYSDNPSALYDFYYVRNTNLDNGYFVKESVWSFDIRYEFDTISNEYLFKMFIESADTNRSGTFKNYYRIK